MPAARARAASSALPRPDTPIDRNAPAAGERADAARRLEPVDARQRHVHQHRVVAPPRDRLDRRLAGADEIGAVAELGQDRVEHHPPIGIVLDAQDIERTQRPPRAVGRAVSRAAPRVRDPIDQ